MRLTPVEQKLMDTLAPVAAGHGLRLVAVRILGEDKGPTLQVMAEDPATGSLGIDECAKLSREISAILDVEDPISGAYRLEVSSPGIDRPLIRVEDFEDFKTFEAKIEIAPPIEGQKNFRGFIKAVENNEIVLVTDTGEVFLPYGHIQKAKLVLTDDLIKRSSARARRQ